MATTFSEIHHIPGRGFKFILTSTWGNDPVWWAYFSNGWFNQHLEFYVFFFRYTKLRRSSTFTKRPLCFLENLSTFWNDSQGDMVVWTSRGGSVRWICFFVFFFFFSDVSPREYVNVHENFMDEILWKQFKFSWKSGSLILIHINLFISFLNWSLRYNMEISCAPGC